RRVTLGTAIPLARARQRGAGRRPLRFMRGRWWSGITSRLRPEQGTTRAPRRTPREGARSGAFPFSRDTRRRRGVGTAESRVRAMTPKFLNPRDVPAPVGPYSHTALVSSAAQIVLLAGQVGMRPDGSIPDGFAEQAEVTFANLRACLAAHGLGVDAVVRL